MRALTLVSVLLTVAWLSAGCSPSDTPATATSESAQPAGASVMVQNIAFTPASMKVLRGTTVRWSSADANVRHTVTSGQPGERAVPGVQDGTDAEPDGTFDGDLPDAGSEFSFTFDEPGTYAYFCEIHPSMSADIVVE